jgi:FkbM family methyltransferase
MTFIDVGANVGFYTALAAAAVGPEGRILAFEPSGYAFPRLARMVQANQLGCVTVFQCGLGDQPGQTTLFGGVEDDPLGNHTASMVPHENPQRCVVEIDTLDRVAERLNVEHIDLLKIDVEGFEMRVLQGAAALIQASRIDHILIECNEYWLERINTSTTEITQFLLANGFRKFTRIGRSDNYLFSISAD